MRLVLYSTAHCALCEQAFDLLASMPEARGARLDVIDVAHDDGLLVRYGPRLPVVVVAGHELAWPFDRAVLAALLRQGAD